MSYLARMPLESIPRATRPALAVDLAVSALLADNVFSFAEVLDHPIAASIGAGPSGEASAPGAAQSSSSSSSAASAAAGAGGSTAGKVEVTEPWLADLMRAADRGDVEAVATCISSNAAGIERHAALKAGLEAFKAKAVLMALMSAAAARPPAERSLAFAEIADTCGLDKAQVEWVVMRAVAKGLIEATIDGVDEVVHVRYVRPRALGREAVGKLGEAVRAWSQRTHVQLVTVQDSARDIMS